MNFYQKHTYLIWQLIGWGLVLAAFIVLLVNLNDYNHDYILGSIVFLTMFGTFAIFCLSSCDLAGGSAIKPGAGTQPLYHRAPLQTAPGAGSYLGIVRYFHFFRGDHGYCAVRAFLFVSAWLLYGGSTVFTSPVRCQKEILSNSRRGKVLSDF